MYLKKWRGKQRKKARKHAEEKIHTRGDLAPCWSWAVPSLAVERDFPMSGSQLLFTAQMPPENIKRKRKENVKSLYF